MSDFIIDEAKIEDIADIASIYDYYVKNTIICLDENISAIDKIKDAYDLVKCYGLPYLVARIDNKVVGYAYAVQYRPRSAYRFAVEQSVYVHPDFGGQKIGTSLVSNLLGRCEAIGIRQVVAVITRNENLASIKLHEKFDFKKKGILDSIAYKHDQWVDTVFLQKDLGKGNSVPPIEKVDVK